MTHEELCIAALAISESLILSLGKKTDGKYIPFTSSSADVFVNANRVSFSSACLINIPTNYHILSIISINMHSLSGTQQKLDLSQGALVEIKATAVVE